MYRNKTLVIKLNTNERLAVKRLAAREHLPPSTMARQMLLKEAERRGLLPEPRRRPEGLNVVNEVNKVSPAV